MKLLKHVIHLFDLAKEFKVDPKIIHNLLKNKTNQHQAITELAKLKRENESLISIIGSLVVEKKNPVPFLLVLW
jgi:hypothetical protein